MGGTGMILTSLKDLAMREGLATNPDYEPKPVSWIIRLDTRGAYLGLISTLSEQSPKKKLLPTVMNIPRRSGRTSAVMPDFLVDKSEYVLGIEPNGRRKPEDLECRRVLFAGLVRTAANHLNSAELKSISQFLDSETERSRCNADLKQQEYFSGMRQLQTDRVRQCLVCGDLRPPVEKHPRIRLRGGTSSGVALVSFNEDAFESYGWSRNENAPVCRFCTDAYTTALTRLLSDRYPDPKHPGSFLARRSISISSDTTEHCRAASSFALRRAPVGTQWLRRK